MNQKIIAVTIAAALSLPMLAHAEGAYLGANIGRSDLKADGDTRDQTAYKAYAGYDFTKNFGVEAAYVDFGKIKERDGNSSLSVKSSAFYVAATANWPLSEQFSLFAKAGASANRVKVDYSEPGFSENTKENKTSVMFGIGGVYAINKNLSVVAEYENFGKIYNRDGGDLKANLFSAGLRYKF
ncbi:outer membrane protein [Janthinobacterium agaricidamnosum]|uniref:OmpA-like transmembrane domain protein n=1 Tax=Janthinobacterium agaricidamnosum NBRC 102515 = DSM 9628 TaxID=1349767 RepID=W0VA64_9BURK|nr:porin [Janthinobacterium agaricidamnosum]CDG84162.1 ompA-like transmembrane domain protein [Janthinobacterium agaricidamnosum NBRC 102515 = DSM 9628]